MINVIVNGCNGHMGKEIINALQNNGEIKLFGKTGRNDNLAAEIKSGKAHIVVDFTHPSAAYYNIITIVENGAHGVIGTSGINEKQRIDIDNLARTPPGHFNCAEFLHRGNINDEICSRICEVYVLC